MEEGPLKIVLFYYRRADDPTGAAYAGSAELASNELPGAVISIRCPLCGQTPHIPFQPAGSWPRSILMICDEPGRTHWLDERQPQLPSAEH
jgi:hypothetical protein